ncbi:hypothetical protein CSA17_01060 [bacterium DOLJORAL78_65_58]|nr:MAG: hypothetical protein CSB20_04895 [bacterium DOLZORAL124_64_63]PIE76667.1 MAG: hypothetical protein CSA17_01060 [bacterium DOLJORAL78_65_58]
MTRIMAEDLAASPSCRVLLMAPNWLGDTIMMAPLIEYLHRRRHLPDGRVLRLELGVRSAWAPLFAADPRLADLLTVDRGGRHGGPLGSWRLGRDLAAREPLAVVLGPPSLRFGLAAFFSGARHRVGYRSDRRGWLLTRGLPVLPRGTRHHGRELLELGPALLSALLPERDDPRDNPDETRPEVTLPGCDGIAPHPAARKGEYWVLAPGATYGSAKSWPLDRATELAREVLATGRTRLVLLGDAAATEFTQALAANLDRQAARDLESDASLVDLAGRTDLRAVVAVLKGCRLFVGNDSGLMHLAGALQRPTIGIFGSSNPHWTHPLGRRTRVLTPEDFSCRPCYRKTCNQPRFCLETVQATEVLAVAHALLEGKD